jgi:hypothetical protein
MQQSILFRFIEELSVSLRVSIIKSVLLIESFLHFDKYIWNFGFDKKLKKIIVAPYILELDVIIEPLLFENNEVLCNTTISNGLIENSNC